MTRRRAGSTTKGTSSSPVPDREGTLPLTFTSDTYGDRFIGIALGNTVAIEYDFDGDGQLDTSFEFRLVPGD